MLQVQYEIGVGKLVLGPLRGVLDDHHPPIVRERKALANCVLEYDAAKNKLARARDAAATQWVAFESAAHSLRFSVVSLLATAVQQGLFSCTFMAIARHHFPVLFSMTIFKFELDPFWR